MKKIRVTMIVIFVAFLALVSGGSLLMKDREFSPNENRYLAEPPRLTVDNILSGKFQDGLENYLRDQICFRDGWITVKTGIQKACKDTDIGGAYVGKDGYDFEKITPEDVDEKQITRNVKAVQDFFAKVSENVEKERLSFLLVPSSGLVMEDKLPAHARLFDQAKYIDQIEKQMTDCRVTDVRKDLLSHKDDYIYYKTDHHWTTLGAFYAFQAAAPSLGIEGDLSGKYVSHAVSNSFNGMLASKSGVNLGEKEQIDIYVPTEEDTDLIVDYVDEGKRSTSLYDSSKLKEKDQYTVFLGGNSSLLDIRTVSTSTKRLLLVKDSFANSFIPFLTPYYREIVVVDPRYYSGTINDLMDSYRISEVLFLYSGNTFFKDNNISGVFAVE